VPAVVVEGKWLISGGQPAGVFEEALRGMAGSGWAGGLRPWSREGRKTVSRQAVEPAETQHPFARLPHCDVIKHRIGSVRKDVQSIQAIAEHTSVHLFDNFLRSVRVSCVLPPTLNPTPAVLRIFV
jgi:hypothetical protein